MRCSCEFDPNQRPVSICNYHDAAFKFTAKKAMENFFRSIISFC